MDQLIHHISAIAKLYDLVVIVVLRCNPLDDPYVSKNERFCLQTFLADFEVTTQVSIIFEDK